MVLIGCLWTCDHSVSGTWTIAAWVDQKHPLKSGSHRSMIGTGMTF